MDPANLSAPIPDQKARTSPGMGSSFPPQRLTNDEGFFSVIKTGFQDMVDFFNSDLLSVASDRSLSERQSVDAIRHAYLQIHAEQLVDARKWLDEGLFEGCVEAYQICDAIVGHKYAIEAHKEVAGGLLERIKSECPSSVMIVANARKEMKRAQESRDRQFEQQRVLATEQKTAVEQAFDEAGDAFSDMLSEVLS